MGKPAEVSTLPGSRVGQGLRELPDNLSGKEHSIFGLSLLLCPPPKQHGTITLLHRGVQNKCSGEHRPWLTV